MADEVADLLAAGVVDGLAEIAARHGVGEPGRPGQPAADHQRNPQSGAQTNSQGSDDHDQQRGARLFVKPLALGDPLVHPVLVEGN